MGIKMEPFHHLHSLQSFSGILCTILGKKFILSKHNNCPILINLYNELNNGSDKQTKEFIFEFGLDNFFRMSNIAWLNGIPTLLEKIEDGINLKFDAIFVHKFGYQATTIWTGTKPEFIPVLNDRELLFVNELLNIQVHCITFVKGVPCVYIYIDGAIKKIPISCNCVSLDGYKLKSNEELMKVCSLIHPVEAVAKVYKCISLNSSQKYMYICVDVHIGQTQLECFEQSDFKFGNVFKVNYPYELVHSENCSKIYFDIKFELKFVGNDYFMYFNINLKDISFQCEESMLDEIGKNMSFVGKAHVLYIKKIDDVAIWDVLILELNLNKTNHGGTDNLPNIISQQIHTEENDNKVTTISRTSSNIEDNKLSLIDKASKNNFENITSSLDSIQCETSKDPYLNRTENIVKLSSGFNSMQNDCKGTLHQTSFKINNLKHSVADNFSTKNKENLIATTFDPIKCQNREVAYSTSNRTENVTKMIHLNHIENSTFSKISSEKEKLNCLLADNSSGKINLSFNGSISSENSVHYKSSQVEYPKCTGAIPKHSIPISKQIKGTEIGLNKKQCSVTEIPKNILSEPKNDILIDKIFLNCLLYFYGYYTAILSTNKLLIVLLLDDVCYSANTAYTSVSKFKSNEISALVVKLPHNIYIGNWCITHRALVAWNGKKSEIKEDVDAEFIARYKIFSENSSRSKKFMNQVEDQLKLELNLLNSYPILKNIPKIDPCVNDPKAAQKKLNINKYFINCNLCFEGSLILLLASNNVFILAIKEDFYYKANVPKIEINPQQQVSTFFIKLKFNVGQIKFDHASLVAWQGKKSSLKENVDLKFIKKHEMFTKTPYLIKRKLEENIKKDKKFIDFLHQHSITNEASLREFLNVNPSKTAILSANSNLNSVINKTSVQNVQMLNYNSTDSLKTGSNNKSSQVLKEKNNFAKSSVITSKPLKPVKPTPNKPLTISRSKKESQSGNILHLMPEVLLPSDIPVPVAPVAREMHNNLNSKIFNSTGILKRVDEISGDVETPNKILHSFTRQNCFLYGLSLYNFSLKDVIKEGCVVEFELQDETLVTNVWIGGRPELNKELMYNYILNWCKKHSVSSGTKLKLLVETGWIPSNCEPLHSNDFSSKIVPL